MSFGLVGSAGSAVSVACGTIVFYVLKYMVGAKKAFEDSGEEDLLTKLRALLEGIIKYKEMLVCAAAFALIVLVVYMIRRMSINYAWTIAMVTGALTGILTILVGDIMYKTDISVVGLILGTILACGVVKVIQFLVFDVDYSRTEKVQFEDDDYYYYVKAVPKITAGNIKDNKDASDVSSRISLKKKAAEKEAEAQPKKPAASVQKEKNATEAPKQDAPRRRPSSKVQEMDIDKEFSKERAAYEARQAEIQRRREAARRREERLRQTAEEQAPATEVVQEEDSDLGMSRRMAYQRRKLEERLTRNDKE